VAPTGILAGNNVCSGSQVTLTVSGGSLGTGASWVWYSGPNHTGAFGKGMSMVTQSPTSTTTYYVRAEGPCNNTADASVTVNVHSTPAVSVSIAGGSSSTLKKATCDAGGQDRGVFTATPLGDTNITSIVWWVRYNNDPDLGPQQVQSGGRILVISNNGRTLSAVPQDSITIWCEVTATCASGSITSNQAMYLVPTYDDAGNCTEVP